MRFLRRDGGDFYVLKTVSTIIWWRVAVVAGCFRAFAKAKKGGKPQRIILENTPAHRAEEIAEELEKLGNFKIVLNCENP